MKNKLSFVIPIFNEAESLPELYWQLYDILSSVLKHHSYEIIFINDGSTDNSVEVLKGLSKQNESIRIISLRKNCGKAVALNKGFEAAKGEIVITLDGDLQDGPENIPEMLKKIAEGYDLVVGWKKKRHDSLGKTLPSKAFNFFVGWLSGLPLHDFNSGFKAMKNQVVKELYLYGELHRFIPVLVSQRGFKIIEIPVTHHPRKYGNSKYGWSRLFKGLFDFLTVMFLGSFGDRPLHLFGILGSVSISIGLIFGAYLSLLHFQGISIGRRPLLILSVLLIIAGLQILLSGLVAEMIVRRSKTPGYPPIDYETH